MTRDVAYVRLSREQPELQRRVCDERAAPIFPWRLIGTIGLALSMGKRDQKTNVPTT
jgi:hypothetical protein